MGGQERIHLLMGWLLGRQLIGQRCVERIGYEYGSVRLPQLPGISEQQAIMVVKDLQMMADGYSVQKTGYVALDIALSNGAISRSDDGNIRLWVSGYVYELNEAGDGWQAGELVPQGIYTIIAPEIIWSSRDILNSDGSLHLAAQAPTPVYE